jgi:antitoxin component YwqK of YwqJK toxin-antitoxin module
MIFYSVGKRVKDFVKVILNPAALKRRENNFESGGAAKRVIHKYPSGRVKGELIYKNGKLNGISTLFYENGTIKSKENYKDGVLDGLAKYYYEGGRIMREEFYRNGHLLFKRVFSLDGSVTSETKY